MKILQKEFGKFSQKWVYWCILHLRIFLKVSLLQPHLKKYEKLKRLNLAEFLYIGELFFEHF